MDSLNELSDDGLLARVERLAVDEKIALADLLAHLAEVDRRGAFKAAGFSSLFDYCIRRLKYSEDEAYRKIHAARAAGGYPQVYPMLADGRLSLSVLSKLAPHLNPENAQELINACVGKAKREVEEMLAARFPREDRPDRIRPLRVEATSVEGRQNDRFEFSFTGSRHLKDSLERAAEILSHSLSSGGLEEVVGVVVSEFLERREPQVLLISAVPSTPDRSAKRVRRVPTRVRNAVWARDGGRCSFVAADGTRCQTRRLLEIDHVVPYSLGGRSDDVSNLRLLCAAHNDYERRRILGEGRQLELSTDLARAKFQGD